jgi:CheY-like chemotaxis protein
VSWRGKDRTTPPPGAPPGGGGKTFAAPPGFRDSPQPPLGAGEVVLSTYQIRRELARSDAGATIEAWDMLLERGVALKIAWKDPGTPALLPEARRCASVADDGAVAIYGLGNHKGSELVIGELISGVTLGRHVQAYLQSGSAVPPGEVLEVLVNLARALAAAHRARVAVGEISGETVLVTPQRRTVLGRFSLGQVPAIGAADVCWAPEVITGQVSAADPQAAAAIDLYGLGCAAVELATGRPPYVGDTVKATLFGHVHHRPPALAELRADLPVELGDLVVELLAKTPAARPAQADMVVDQLIAIQERASATRRVIRVLVVDDDSERVRGLWSVIRRGHSRATVDAARDGADAANRVRRDHPDVIVIDTTLGAQAGAAGAAGSMNALELVMLIASLEEARGAVVVVIGDRFEPRDAQVLAQAGVHHTLVRDAQTSAALIEIVRRAASATRFQRPHGRITVSG